MPRDGTAASATSGAPRPPARTSLLAEGGHGLTPSIPRCPAACPAAERQLGHLCQAPCTWEPEESISPGPQTPSPQAGAVRPSLRLGDKRGLLREDQAVEKVRGLVQACWVLPVGQVQKPSSSTTTRLQHGEGLGQRRGPPDDMEWGQAQCRAYLE